MSYYDNEPDEEEFNDMAVEGKVEQEPTKMTVSIEGLNFGDIEDRIARILVGSADFDMKRIREHVHTAAVKAVDAVVQDIAREKLTEIVTAAIDLQIPVTNQYGERTGTTVSIRARMEELSKSILGGRVDDRGNPSSSGMTLVEYIIKKHALNPVLENAKAEVEKVAAEAKKQVAAAVGNFIAQNLAVPTIAQAAAQLPKA